MHDINDINVAAFSQLLYKHCFNDDKVPVDMETTLPLRGILLSGVS